MSQGRKYYGIDELKEINKALGFKAKKQAQQAQRNYDEQKRKAQRAKFCKCKTCGGMMTYVKGTNSLICENIVEKKKSKEVDGKTQTTKVTERCGAVNLVEDKYVSYLAYLFDGLPGNQAVIDAKEAK